MKKLKPILKKHLQKLLALIKRENTVYYINGPETLPPPLSKQDEEIIFKKITDGDEVMQQMLSTMHSVDINHSDAAVENELHEIFNTIN